MKEEIWKTKKNVCEGKEDEKEKRWRRRREGEGKGNDVEEEGRRVVRRL